MWLWNTHRSTARLRNTHWTTTAKKQYNSPKWRSNLSCYAYASCGNNIKPPVILTNGSQNTLKTCMLSLSVYVTGRLRNPLSYPGPEDAYFNQCCYPYLWGSPIIIVFIDLPDSPWREEEQEKNPQRNYTRTWIIIFIRHLLLLPHGDINLLSSGSKVSKLADSAECMSWVSQTTNIVHCPTEILEGVALSRAV
jgi:hypothetical protein